MLFSGKTLAVFPLPDLVLFPKVKVPLHIFEPRYHQMVSELIDSHGHFSIATYCDPKTPRDFYSTGCLAKIIDYTPLDGQRYNIVIEGVERIRLWEKDSEKLYRQAQVEVQETDIDLLTDNGIIALKEQLIIFLKHLDENINLDPQFRDRIIAMPADELVYYMSFIAPVPVSNKQELLEYDCLRETIPMLLRLFQQ